MPKDIRFAADTKQKGIYTLDSRPKLAKNNRRLVALDFVIRSGPPDTCAQACTSTREIANENSIYTPESYNCTPHSEPRDNLVLLGFLQESLYEDDTRVRLLGGFYHRSGPRQQASLSVRNGARGSDGIREDTQLLSAGDPVPHAVSIRPS